MPLLSSGVQSLGKCLWTSTLPIVKFDKKYRKQGNNDSPPPLNKSSFLLYGFSRNPQMHNGITTTYNYLLTPWCRVLLEKLTGLQIVKKFPAFHGTRRFITALTSVRHLSLSWASPIQSIYPHTTSWRSILILSTHLRLGLPSGLPHVSVS